MEETPVKKRRRPALACEQCRKRKIRCDRNLPCNHCLKANQNDCTYAPTHVPKSRSKKTSSPAASFVQTTTHSTPHLVVLGTHTSAKEPSEYFSATTTGIPQHITGNLSSSSNSAACSSASTVKTPTTSFINSPDKINVEQLISRVNELEKRLAEVGHDENASGTDALRSKTVPIKGTVCKTRYFGQSHWTNGATLLPVDIQCLVRAGAEQSDLFQILGQCKLLGRKIKENRLRPLFSDNLGRSVPARELADQLIENYLRTFEGVFRILHIPTFQTDYERYWKSPTASNLALVLLMQLCMALGCLVHENCRSLRSLAIQWIHEAQLWLTLPSEKSRLTLGSIQIMCLLTLAKSMLGVGQDLTWIMNGSLLRTAMYMGLHRDPKYLSDMTVYRAEMRRRLWATILELNLQSSFEAGGSPLLSEFDYDTQPPANLDDEQLTDESDLTRRPAAALDRPTQTSIQVALFASYRLRAKIIKRINDFSSEAVFDQILRDNDELTSACTVFTKNVSSLMSMVDVSQRKRPPITQFHKLVGDLVLCRYFHTLHIPIVAKSFRDPKFYFSRKTCMDSALKIAEMCGMAESQVSSASPDSATADFRQMCITAYGMFRNAPVQTMMTFAAELHDRTSQPSDMGFSPNSGGAANIRNILESYVKHALNRMHAGEVSVKGHCFLSGCLAHADALEVGLDQEATEALIIKKATEASQLSLQVLTDMARIDGVAHESSIDNEVAADNPVTQDSMGTALTAEWQDGWAWDELDSWMPSWWQTQMSMSMPEIDMSQSLLGNS